MKAILIILFCSPALMQTIGQSLLTDPVDRISEIKDIVFLSEDEYVVASTERFETQAKIEFYKGKEIIRTINVPINRVANIDLKMLEEGLHLSLIGIDQCDIHWNNYYEVLLDTLDVDEIDIPYEPSSYGLVRNAEMFEKEVLVTIYGYADGENSEGIRIFDMGEEVLALNLPETRLNFIKSIDDTAYIYGGHDLIVLDIPNREIVTQYNFASEEFLDLEPSDIEGEYYVLTNQNLYLGSADSLTLIKSFEDNLYTYRDMIFSGQLFLLGESEDNENMVWKIEEGELVQMQDMIPENQVSITQMFHGPEEEIVFAGQVILFFETFTQYPVKGAYVFTGPFKANVKIPNFEVNLLNVEGDGNRHIKCTVELTNHSPSDTLNNIRLFSSSISGAWCSSSRIDMTIECLLPSETKTVEGSAIFYFVPNSYQGNFCVYATNSKNVLDGNIIDNISCIEITSTSDLNVNADPVIYPNPAIDWISINQSALHKFTIYNIRGAKILEGQKQKSISVSNLEPATYFIELINDRGEKTFSKFIKVSQ